MMPIAIPRVITHRIVTYADGSVIVAPASSSRASRVFPAATVSYEREPMTESLSQGSAMPRLFERATTPTNIAIIGNKNIIVNDNLNTKPSPYITKHITIRKLRISLPKTFVEKYEKDTVSG